MEDNISFNPNRSGRDMDGEEVVAKFEKFVKRTHLPKLLKAIRAGEKSLVVNFKELDRYDTDLSDLLLGDPDKALELFSRALENLDLPTEEKVFVRFSGLPKSTSVKIRDLRSKHLVKTVTVNGIIRQASEVRPEVIEATFECPDCGNHIVVPQDGLVFTKPSMCICGRRSKFKVLEKKFTDMQTLTIEEHPEDLSGAQQPSRIKALLYDDLVDPELREKLTPGNRVCINGILREMPIRANGGAIKKLYDIYVGANYVEPTVQDFEQVKVSPEEEEKIREMASSPDIWDRIVSSLAPSIYGHRKVKEAIVLQLFGGLRKERPDGVVTRGDMHILLIGDPGAGKTQLLKYVSGLAPKARYVSGKGASAAGLTATVVKDEVLKGWTLEAGALVLANNGIALVDEIDKMTPEDRSAMHEALEQQTVTVNKATIHATLNARAAVLGAANPKYSRFDPYKTVAEQIEMPDTLLSRFDLIFPIRDIPDSGKDERLADHILKLHQSPEAAPPEISTDFLRKYISYARRKCRPQLSKEAVSTIKKFFVSLRGKYAGDESNSVPISPRQLEALVRMSEASARVTLNDVVSKEDAERAVDLLRYCLSLVATDPETGMLDIDRLEGGVPSSKRNKLRLLMGVIEDLEGEEGKNVPIVKIVERATTRGIDERTCEELLNDLKKKGDIMEPRTGLIQRL